jgi:hypothetical protein
MRSVKINDQQLLEKNKIEGHQLLVYYTLKYP